ncbi:MAG: hypothetical protein RIF41_29690 [Polyangiaceae bacterium]
MGVTQGPSIISATASARAIHLTVAGLFAGRAYRHAGYRAFRARHDRFVLQDGQGRVLVEADNPTCVAALFTTLSSTLDVPSDDEQRGPSYLRKREVPLDDPRAPDVLHGHVLKDWATRPRPRRRAVAPWRDGASAA